MEFKDYRTYGTLLTIVMVVLVGWAFTTGNTVAAVAVIILWLFIIQTLRKGVDELLHDERVLKVSGIASRKAYQTLAIILGLAGAVIMFSEPLYQEYRLVAIAFLYVLCAMAILYTMFYMYYHHRALE